MHLHAVSLVRACNNHDVFGAPSYRGGTTLLSTGSCCKGPSLNASTSRTCMRHMVSGTWSNISSCRDGPYIRRGTVSFPVAALRPVHSSCVLATGGGPAVVAVVVGSTAVIGGTVVAIVTSIVLVDLTHSTIHDVLGAPSCRCGITLLSTSSC